MVRLNSPERTSVHSGSAPRHTQVEVRKDVRIQAWFQTWFPETSKEVSLTEARRGSATIDLFRLCWALLMDVAEGANRLGAWVGDWVGGIFFAAVLFFGVPRAELFAYALHPVAGITLAGVAVALSLALVWAVTRPGSLSTHGPVKVVTNVLAWIAGGSIAAFASLAFVLFRANLTEYHAALAIDPDVLARHFGWQLIDMVPSLAIWKTLDVPDPVDDQGLTTRLLTLAFRLVIAGRLVQFGRAWLDHARHPPGRADRGDTPAVSA